MLVFDFYCFFFIHEPELKRKSGPRPLVCKNGAGSIPPGRLLNEVDCVFDLGTVVVTIVSTQFLFLEAFSYSSEYFRSFLKK